MRTIKKPDERRTEILEYSLQLFVDNGFENTSVRSIIDAIGIAKGTFYYYFKSKEELLDEIVNSETEAFVGIINDIADLPNLSAIDKMNAISMNFKNYRDEKRSFLLNLIRIMNQAGHLKLSHKFNETVAIKSRAGYSKIIRQGIEEGVFHTNHPEKITDVIIRMSNLYKIRIAQILLKEPRDEKALKEAYTITEFIQEMVEKLLGMKPNTFKPSEAIMSNLNAWLEDEENR